jgi:hypothetical protein
MAFPVRKTVVGPTGRSPIKTVAGSVPSTPVKTVTGAMSRSPVKTVVGSTAAPVRKTLVGATAAPPRKTMPGNLGTGGTSALGPGFTEQHNNAASPRTPSRSLGRGDGNMGRSVGSGMRPSPGPPNASLQWNKSSGADDIVPGGMGAAAKSMGRAPVPRRGSVRRNPMFGG